MSQQSTQHDRDETAENVYLGLRKVHKSGNSLVVSIPLEEAEACGLDRDDLVGNKFARLKDDGRFCVDLCD